MYKKALIYAFIAFVFILNIFLDFNIKNYFKILQLCFGENVSLDYKIYTSICSIIAIISFLIVLDILLVVYKNKSREKGFKLKTEDGTFGTANWMNENKMREVLGTSESEGIILGKYKNEIIKLPFESYFNKNICVFGSSRKYENNRLFAYKLTGAI